MGGILGKARAICLCLTGMAAAGLEEILAGAWHWRVWHLLGARDLQHRYARSSLGQLWLIVSSAIMIGAIRPPLWAIVGRRSSPDCLGNHRDLSYGPGILGVHRFNARPGRAAGIDRSHQRR
jgi:hypothetical protein